MRVPDLSSTTLTRTIDAETELSEEHLWNDVARRLARACAHLEPGSFAHLVQTIVARKLRWARRDAEEMIAAHASR